MKPVKEPVVYEELTYKIIGCAMRVHRELGSVHKEVVYQKALEKELNDSGLNVTRELQLPVQYKDMKVGVYRPDMVVNEKVILELKVLPFLV